MKPLSRRSIIAGSAAAVTALPALGLCKDATEGGGFAVRPDPIFAAIADHRALFKEVDRLYQKLDEAEDLAEAIYGKRPMELITWRNYLIGDGEIDERLEWFQSGHLWQGEDPKQIEREYHDAKRRYREIIRGGKAWDKRTGIAPLRKKCERARAAEHKAASQLAKTKPTTAAGAGTLVAYINRDIGGGHCCPWHGGALKNAAASLKGMEVHG